MLQPAKAGKVPFEKLKLVDSSNSYCLKFDIYADDVFQPQITDFGKVHDLLIQLSREYLDKSYILYMDNWYTSPILFYNLCCVDTGACGTSRYRRGYPGAMFKDKLKKKGYSVTIHRNKMVVVQIFDCKAFCIASTVYPGRLILGRHTGKQRK